MSDQVYVVAGMAYGDEGKGATVDFLVREKKAGLVVRYNGGPQAGHNVVLPDGRHHTFSQFGSGTFVTGVRTHLSRFMLVNPISMMEEEKHLRSIGVSDAFKRLTVDAEALIVTPFQRAVNRIEQLAWESHSSCGAGVGQCRSDHIKHGGKVLFAGEIENDFFLERKLTFLQEISRAAAIQACSSRQDMLNTKRVREEFEVLEDPNAIDWVARKYERWRRKVSVVDSLELADLLDQTSCTIFEGAQGVLLDEVVGEAAFNTWTCTTFENALRLLKECGYIGPICKLGVVRTYFTRHGDGPLEMENPEYLKIYPEKHNNDKGWQGRFRTANFDLDKFYYAITACGGVDALALNHLASVDESTKSIMNAPVLIEGFGPTWEHRKFNKDLDSDLQSKEKRNGRDEIARAVGSGEESRDSSSEAPHRAAEDLHG